MVNILIFFGVLVFCVIWVLCLIDFVNAPEADEQGNIINDKK